MRIFTTLRVVYMLAAAGIALCAVPQGANAACDTGSLARVSYGQSGSAVTALQGCLIAAGYDIPAGPTGYYGAQTVAAVRAFYAAALSMPEWDGRSVGPQGRASLVAHAGTVVGGASTGYKRVGSADEFSRYLAEREAMNKVTQVSSVLAPEMRTTDALSAPTAAMEESIADSGAARVSETTVQVAGIDEPDIVKTDGDALYVSREGSWGGRVVPMVEFDAGGTVVATDVVLPPTHTMGGVTVVDAYPPKDMKVASETIAERGELLLARDAQTLVVFAYPSIVAYNVADPEKPVQAWTLALGENTQLVAARLYDGTLYIVTSTWLTTGTVPCPVMPMLRTDAGTTGEVRIPCADVWVPEHIEPVDRTITVLAVDPRSGETERSLALASDGEVGTVSMFHGDLYLASGVPTAPYDVMRDMVLSAYASHVSVATYAKMQRIAGYDLSAAGRVQEMLLAAQADLARLSADERMLVENEVANTMRDGFSLRKRELERTRITRVPLATLSIAAVGTVPGTLLNQFSLDEYGDAVRVAVTVGGRSWWQWGMWGSGETENDVYVLGKQDLVTRGSIQGLGLGERVYAARFIEDRGYLVTFRQVDPFYVLDLSDPMSPKRVGELKIPGYSAYLEPLGDDLVLGVGREGSGVKLSVFDVSNPAAPVERSKYLLKETWSEVENNHHAFLRDPDHEVIFLPGGDGGYVFSYAGGALSLKATVSGWSVKRAVYLDDYLYIVGDETITVLDERTWKKVSTLAL